MIGTLTGARTRASRCATPWTADHRDDHRPGPTQTLPQLTVARTETPVCADVPARAGVSFYAVCGKTRLVITLYGTGPSITVES